MYPLQLGQGVWCRPLLLPLLLLLLLLLLAGCV
jgi:hypothetical protein